MEQQYYLPRGTLLQNGRYAVEAAIGEGGFGITYLAMDQNLQNHVAIKELFPGGLVCRGGNHLDVCPLGDEQQQEFERGRSFLKQEAAILARYQQLPCIVDVLAFFTENQTAYLVMEYLEGETLQEHLQTVGRISVSWLAEKLEPLMDDLEKLHAAGLVHGDISPDNIILTKDGRLVLIDFGSTARVSPDHAAVAMKLPYTAPEAYTPGGQRPESDIYALCAVFYHCATGRKPLSAAERAHTGMKWPSQLDASIPGGVDHFLKRGMALRASQRYHSMGALKRAMCRDVYRRTRWYFYAAPAAALLLVAAVFILPKINWHSNVSEEPSPEPSVVTEDTDPTPSEEPSPEPDVETEDTDPTPPEELVKEQKPELYDLELVQTGELRDYFVNDTLDTDGIKLLATYTDNSKKELTAKDVSIQYDFSEPGEREVKLEYEGETVSFQVEVLSDLDKDYMQAQALLENGDRLGAARAFFAIGDYKDALDRASDLWDVICRRKTIAVDRSGSGYACITANQTCEKLKGAEGLVEIACGWLGSYVGLKKDGTVAANEDALEDFPQISTWTNIVALGTGGNYLLGVKADGSVVAAGTDNFGTCDVDSWGDIVVADGSYAYSFGVRSDGTVVANVEGSASNVLDVASGNYFAVFLFSDGTVGAFGTEMTTKEDVAKWVADWTDIIAIDASDSHVVGLKADGTVVTAGPNYSGRCDVSDWKDIVQIAAGGYCTLGLRADGTVVYAGVDADQMQQPILTNVRIPVLN